jgi:Transposase.
MVVNARHIKHVPGRKTDVKDSEWIAQLLRKGLLKGSFIPPRPIRELRDLTRYRKKLVHARTAERNRVQKIPGRCKHQSGLRPFGSVWRIRHSHFKSVARRPLLHLRGIGSDGSLESETEITGASPIPRGSIFGPPSLSAEYDPGASRIGRVLYDEGGSPD